MIADSLFREGMRGLRTLVAATLLSALSVAAAHATIVFATMVPVPNPPPANAPFDLELSMVDPTQLAVEDAIVLAELTPATGGATVETEFAEFAPGRYRATVVLPETGEYRVLMRDRTFRQEEARQTVTLTVDGSAVDPVEFVFPPTATGNRSIGVWLAWLVGVPLVVGIVVTVVVLIRTPNDAAGADAATPGKAPPNRDGDV